MVVVYVYFDVICVIGVGVVLGIGCFGVVFSMFLGVVVFSNGGGFGYFVLIVGVMVIMLVVFVILFCYIFCLVEL